MKPRHQRRSAIAHSSAKADRLYGKGELTPAEDALLRRVISLLQASANLTRERSELAAKKKNLPPPP